MAPHITPARSAPVGSPLVSRRFGAGSAGVAVRIIEEPPPPRSVCVYGPRPCPYVLCRSNFGVEVNRRKDHGVRVDADGNLIVSFPTVDSCAKDVAERGATLEEIGTMWGITRERVRQIEVSGLRKVKRDKEMREFFP